MFHKTSTRSATMFALFVFCFTSEFALGDVIRVPQDSSSIKAAIAKAKKGDTVLVDQGVYRETVQLKPGVFLKSKGDDASGSTGLKRSERTIIDGGKEDKTSAVTMAEGSVLDGFTIRNVGTYDEEKWKYHHKTQGNEQSHEQIGRPSVAAISIRCKSCQVKNNIVHHNGYSGIVIDATENPASKPLVSGNVCFRNMGAGISAMNLTRAEITRNRCYENFFAGIGHNKASPHVHLNRCFKNIRAGIGISNGSCPTVELNHCFSNRRAGIGTRTGRATRPVIRKNECYQNEMAGIGTEEDAGPIIVDNRCFKNKLAGIGCRLHASPTIMGNDSFENGRAGIGIEADTTPLILNNRCRLNQTAGIGFAPGTNGQATVLNNRLVENRLVAIGINQGWNVYLAGNVAQRTGGMPPLVMVFKGAKAHFVDNRFEGGGVACIRCAGEAKIELCELLGAQPRLGGPPNFGIWALPGAKVDCRETTIKNWRNALNGSDARIVLNSTKAWGFLQNGFVIKDPKPGSAATGNQGWSYLAQSKLIQSNALEEIATDNQLHQPLKIPFKK